jgi:lipoprotein-releasing system permease protein
MILNRYERMIAKRYLLPGKGEGFIFLVASISLVAVRLGVAALIVVMSVMNGFRAELFDKIVGLNGHAVVQGYGGRLDNWQEIVDRRAARPASPSGAADRAAADGELFGAGRRRAGPRHAAPGHPRQPDAAGQGALGALRSAAGLDNVAIGARLAERWAPGSAARSA